jgi:SAM-dependent methyltransferase
LAAFVTRGNGLLEKWLAKKRASQANHLIPEHLREGRILDIGCGSYPYFLSHTYFKEKFALDRIDTLPANPEIHWFNLDINKIRNLPYEDNYFSVISLLAVLEHLDPNNLVAIFRELYRILQPGGIVILTTPAAWSDRLLHWMADVRLVSKEEIDEHIFAYTLPLLGWYFGRAGFSIEKSHFGYFEFFLNMWAIARK